jgi:chromosome segregation ATPase
MRASDRIRLILLTLAVPALVSAAHAGDGNMQKSEVRRLQQTARRLMEEKAQLEREKADVESKEKETEAKLADATRASSLARARGATLDKDLQAAADAATQLKARLAETERQLAEQSEGRNKAEDEGRRLRAALGAQEAATKDCQAKNVALYRYGQELAEKYKDKGVVDALTQQEPFTGLKRVQIENLLEDYRDKLDSQKIEPAPPQPPVAGR